MQPHHDASHIGKIRQVTHADNTLLHGDLPAILQHLGQGRVNILHFNGIDRPADTLRIHQAAVDPWRGLIAGRDHPISNRPFPLFDLPTEYRPVRGGSLLNLIRS